MAADAGAAVAPPVELQPATQAESNRLESRSWRGLYVVQDAGVFQGAAAAVGEEEEEEVEEEG